MAGYIVEASDPRKFRMEWVTETPLLTAATMRLAALGICGLFALAAGMAYLLDPGAALQAGAIAAGTFVALAGLVVFGLLSNRVHRRFTATADGYCSEISDDRIAWLLPGTTRPFGIRAWSRVERTRLDAEYGRVLIELRGRGREAIHCPAGGFVPVAREIRRLIDAAQSAPPARRPETRGRAASTSGAPRPVSGVAA